MIGVRRQLMSIDLVLVWLMEMLCPGCELPPLRSAELQLSRDLHAHRFTDHRLLFTALGPEAQHQCIHRLG